MNGDLVKLTGKGYIKCIGHTGLDGDPPSYKLMQLEVLCPLFVRNELNAIFHTPCTPTGSFYYPATWYAKTGQPLPEYKQDGMISLWRSHVKHCVDDVDIASADLHPLQAQLFKPVHAEYVSFVTEPLTLEALADMVKKVSSCGPDARSLLNAIKAFMEELWPDTTAKVLF